MKKYSIAIYGAGYVGLSLATLLSPTHAVTVFDVDTEKVEKINKRISPIKDADIQRFFDEKELNLCARYYERGEFNSYDYIILALPTDYQSVTATLNTTTLESVISDIAHTNHQTPIIIKSTVPLGFTDTVSDKYSLMCCFHCPEFLREGLALHDNLFPNRIVIGSKNESARIFGDILVSASNKIDVKVISTDNRTAEAIKLSSNAYLATRIAFFNELDSLAMSADLRMEELILGVCADERIGHGYNNPSFGYGGYCLPKDTLQIEAIFRAEGITAPLIRSITKSNNQRLEFIVDMLMDKAEDVVGVYRLQMKSNSDNSREAVNYKILKELIRRGKNVKLYEPIIQLDEDIAQHNMQDISEFFETCDLIIANRWHDQLTPVRDKVICRDIYHEN